MALPFAVKKSKAWLVEAVGAMIIICIGLLIIVKLAKLIKVKLYNPPKPPKKDDGDAAVAPPGSPTYCMTSLTPGPEDAGTIDEQSADFQSPSGSRYTMMIAMNIETSTDLKNWSPCGSLTIWVSDDYLAVQQIDSTGNTINRLIKDWSTLDYMHGFTAPFPASNARFFRHCSAL